MKIISVQQFVVEYEVPEEELQRFTSLLADNDDEVSDYEVSQRFLGEKIAHIGK
jgi:hypothetical protein